MKTIADKNRIETELRCTPSNINPKKRKTAQRIAIATALCAIIAIAVWMVGGIAKTVFDGGQAHHILIGILALRWLCVRNC